MKDGKRVVSVETARKLSKRVGYTVHWCPSIVVPYTVMYQHDPLEMEEHDQQAIVYEA